MSKVLVINCRNSATGNNEILINFGNKTFLRKMLPAMPTVIHKGYVQKKKLTHIMGWHSVSNIQISTTIDIKKYNKSMGYEI